VLAAKGRNEESGVGTKVTFGLNFFCRSVNVAVGIGMGEFAGVVLVMHPDKINVRINRKTAITICLAIKDAMAFHAETATSGPTETVSAAAGRRPGTPKRERRHTSQVPLFAARVGGRLVMVNEAVAHFTATPEPDVTLSRHPAPQYVGHCHWHLGRATGRDNECEVKPGCCAAW
jgi:hypothetical protein